MPNDHSSPVTPALDSAAVPPRIGSGYPEPFRSQVQGREKRALGDALGLTRFGVNLVRLPPGAMSSVRHWHSHQDELIYVLSGEVVLVTNAGEQTLRPGQAAGFPAGRPDAHHMINRSAEDALYLEVGDRTSGDVSTYPDADLMAVHKGGKYVFTRKDGTPY